jgi:hypothetical protein
MDPSEVGVKDADATEYENEGCVRLGQECWLMRLDMSIMSK